MTISEEQAPVTAAGEIEIEANPDEIWDVLVDFERWPNWNPAVKSVSLEGEAELGRSFRWKAGPGTITSTLRRLERPRELAWTGRTFGIAAVHVWQLEDEHGATRVRTEESWSGLPARLFRRSLGRTLQRSLEDGLRSLKRKVEGSKR